MRESAFVYVTYIRTTPEKLWDALTCNEFIKLYWHGAAQKSDWRPGSPWAILDPRGAVWDSGEILEADRPHRLVLSWRHEHSAELKAEGYSRLTYRIEQQGGTVKLTVSHESSVEDSKLIGAVSGGWPHILASLKSLLETGAPLENTSEWPE